MFGIYVLLEQYLQLVLALSPWEARLATVPFTRASVAGALLSPALANRFHMRSVLVAGLIIAIVGTGMLAVSVGRFGVPGVVASNVVFKLRLASVFTPAYELIVTCAPPERSGGAVAIAETLSELGGVMGIAMLCSLTTAIYRHLLFTTLPQGLLLMSGEKAVATIGGASPIAAMLPPRAGESLRLSARAAFSTAIQFTSVAAAAAIAAAC